jgi:hypothetical protein
MRSPLPRLRLPPSHDRPGDPGCEPLLAVLAQDPHEVALVVGVEDVGRRDAARLVHPHVQRRVLGVGEAALRLVELQRRHPEVHEDALDGAVRVLVDDVGDLVVHGVHRHEPVAEPLETRRGQGERLEVAVDAEDPGGGHLLEHGLGVAAHPERAVHQDAARCGQRGGQQVDAPLHQDGQVPVLRGPFVVGAHGFPLPGGRGGRRTIADRCSVTVRPDRPARSPSAPF